jgi:hypothetical protein
LEPGPGFGVYTVLMLALCPNERLTEAEKAVYSKEDWIGLV